MWVKGAEDMGVQKRELGKTIGRERGGATKEMQQRRFLLLWQLQQHISLA